MLEGKLGVKQLFEFVKNNAETMDAYSMDEATFSGLMDIGIAEKAISLRKVQEM